MSLKSFTTIATKKSGKMEGIAYVKRPLAIKLWNTWRFKLRKTHQMNIEVGVERISNNHQFVINLKSGMAWDSEMPGEWPYLSLLPRQNDVVQVIVSEGVMSITVNAEDQGVVFQHPDLYEPNVYAFIRMKDKGDEAGVMQGSTL